MRRVPGLIALMLSLLAMRAGAEDADGALHVPSPDWREQIIYFAMIDRFDDGDPANNDQGVGEYDPTDGARYSGGDLRGLVRRLDYIRDLGATALWITPPVRHQWWDAAVNYGGYHGYWGENFAEVDPHFGTLADYQTLSRELHARGMVLIQDIVVNHTGNYFAYPRVHDARDPASGYSRNAGSRPNATPTQWPFSQNDARDPKQRSLDVYHWTNNIVDFNDEQQERNHQLASLDDLNTENPLVQRALRASYGHWIDAVGVDAFRVDTAFYVPPEFFGDLLHAEDRLAPGIRQVAARTGREDFLVFGEGFGLDRPYDDAKARKIAAYEQTADQRSGLPAMINFPLYGSLLDVFARGQPSAVLAHRIDSMMALHANPHWMPSFVDNHDVDRFLAGGNEAGLRLALLAIHTLPGIPTIYYGTEQGFTAPRTAMFARGHGAQGQDRFNRRSPLYDYLRRLADLRRNQRALTHGTPRVLDSNAAAAGVLLYAMQHEDDTLLIALSSSPKASLLANADTGLRAGTRLSPLFAISDAAPELVVDAQGRVSAELSAHAGWVWRAGRDAARIASSTDSSILEIGSLPTTVVRGPLPLRGRAGANEDLLLVLDGNLTEALPVRSDARGRWRAEIATDHLIDPTLTHRLVAWTPKAQRASQAQTFRVEPRWTEVALARDAVGDDHGPDGNYVYPDAAAWRERRPADLRSLRASVYGRSLRLEMELGTLLDTWNAPNGFDHVALTLFLELPGRDDGARLMPGQHAALPGDMRWNYRWRLGGWSLAQFGSEGADATNEGQAMTSSATLTLDRARKLVVLTVSAESLGRPASLAGARVYLNTWDYDGGYRALAPQAAAFGFGGAAADAPKLMDEIGPVTLRVSD